MKNSDLKIFNELINREKISNEELDTILKAVCDFIRTLDSPIKLDSLKSIFGCTFANRMEQILLYGFNRGMFILTHEGIVKCD